MEPEQGPPRDSAQEQEPGQKQQQKPDQEQERKPEPKKGQESEQGQQKGQGQEQEHKHDQRLEEDRDQSGPTGDLTQECGKEQQIRTPDTMPTERNERCLVENRPVVELSEPTKAPVNQHPTQQSEHQVGPNPNGDAPIPTDPHDAPQQETLPSTMSGAAGQPGGRTADRDMIPVHEEEIELDDDEFPAAYVEPGCNSPAPAMFSLDGELDEESEALIECLAGQVSRSSTRSIGTQDFNVNHEKHGFEREGKSMRSASRRFVEPGKLTGRSAGSSSPSTSLRLDDYECETTEVVVRETSIEPTESSEDYQRHAQISMQREGKSIRGPSRRFINPIPIASMSIEEVQITESNIGGADSEHDTGAYPNNFSLDGECDSGTEALIEALVGGVGESNLGRSIIVPRSENQPRRNDEEIGQEGFSQRGVSVSVRVKTGGTSSWERDPSSAPSQPLVDPADMFGSLNVVECESGEIEILQVPGIASELSQESSGEESGPATATKKPETFSAIQSRSKSVSFGGSSVRQFSARKRSDSKKSTTSAETEEEDNGVVMVPVHDKTKFKAAVSDANRKCADWASNGDSVFAVSGRVTFDAQQDQPPRTTRPHRRRDPTPYCSRGQTMDMDEDDDSTNQPNKSPSTGHAVPGTRDAKIKSRTGKSTKLRFGDEAEKQKASENGTVSFAKDESPAHVSKKSTRRVAKRDPTPFVSRSFAGYDDEDCEEETSPPARSRRAQRLAPTGGYESTKTERSNEKQAMSGQCEVQSSPRSPRTYGVDASRAVKVRTKAEYLDTSAADQVLPQTNVRRLKKRDPTPWAPRSASAGDDGMKSDSPDSSGPQEVDIVPVGARLKKGDPKEKRSIRKRDPTPWPSRSCNLIESDDEEAGGNSVPRPVLRQTHYSRMDVTGDNEDGFEADARSVIVVAPRTRPKTSANRKAAVRKIRRRDPTPYCARTWSESGDDQEKAGDDNHKGSVRFSHGTCMESKEPLRRRRDSTPHLKRFINLEDFSDYSDEDPQMHPQSTESSCIATSPGSRRVSFGADQAQNHNLKKDRSSAVHCDDDSDKDVSFCDPAPRRSRKSKETENSPRAVSFGQDATYTIEPRVKMANGLARHESSSSSSLSPSSSLTSAETMHDRAIRFESDEAESNGRTSRKAVQRPRRPKRDPTPFVPRSFAHADDGEETDESSGLHSSFDSECGRIGRRSRSRQIEVGDRDCRED